MTNLEISFLAMLGTCTVVMVVFSLIGGVIGPRIGRWLTTRFPDHVARIERERAAKGLAVAPRTPKPQRKRVVDRSIRRGKAQHQRAARLSRLRFGNLPQ